MSYEQNPTIDKGKCISCYICEKTIMLSMILSIKCVTWSSDKYARNSSTSGGIAQELYKYTLANNYSIYGVTLEKYAN